MATPPEPDPGAPEPAPPGPAGGPGRRRRPLDRRTVAICVCVALLGALLAGLAASFVLDDDEPAPTAAPSRMEVVPAASPEPDELLGVELVTVDGAKTSLARLLGPTPVVVNLWAQSCVPCITEMPMLEQVDRDDDRVTFLGVNVLDRLDKAKAMAARTGITYPWVRDPDGDFGAAARTAGLPDTLLVDTDGTVLATKLGAFDDEAELRAWLDEHLP
jgi:cytochrome c biogenesis protein CcmG/thiol:disulfide interchange protein DsbE